jgi:hypothetical protein
MLPADARIISVDDHVIEHPRVWLDRLPAKYAEAAPATARRGDHGHATSRPATDDPPRRPRPPSTGGLKP